MYHEIAKGASGVLKDTCQFDDGWDAHLYLTNSNSDKFKQPLLFQNILTVPDLSLETQLSQQLLMFAHLLYASVVA